MIKLNEQTSEFKELEKEWYREIDTLTTKSKYNAYVNKLISGYEHDFGTSLRALACVVNATIRFYSKGLTSIQAMYLMWTIIKHTFINDKIGMTLICYQKLLDKDFNLTLKMDGEQHKALMEMAQERFTKTNDEETKKYLAEIIKGWLPPFVELIDESEGKA